MHRNSELLSRATRSNWSHARPTTTPRVGSTSWRARSDGRSRAASMRSRSAVGPL